MARTQARPRTCKKVKLQPHQINFRGCGSQMRMGHHSYRMVIKLHGFTQLTHHPSIGAAIRYVCSSTSQCDLTLDRKGVLFSGPKATIVRGAIGMKYGKSKRLCLNKRI